MAGLLLGPTKLYIVIACLAALLALALLQASCTIYKASKKRTTKVKDSSTNMLFDCSFLLFFIICCLSFYILLVCVSRARARRRRDDQRQLSYIERMRFIATLSSSRASAVYVALSSIIYAYG